MDAVVGMVQETNKNPKALRSTQLTRVVRCGGEGEESLQTP